MPQSQETAWLVREDEVLASISVVSGWKSAALGARLSESTDEPVIVCPAFWAQSMFSPFDLDVAFLDADNVIVRTLRLRRNRVATPAISARSVLRAKKGTFGLWELKIGDEMDVRPCE